MAVYLPQDVVVNILARLPVDSIVRFKCVCKSWYSLFLNPNFKDTHLSHQSRTMDHIFLMRAILVPVNHLTLMEDDIKFDVCYLSKDIDDNYAHFAVKADLPPSVINGCPILMLVGHCDGLIAYSDSEEIVCISNPATRESRTLPHSLHPICFEDSRYLVAVGFGYDSYTKDYKIVRVFINYNCSTYPDSVNHSAEVFSIRSDSSWRQINYSMNHAISFSPHDYQHGYYNGIYYWLGTEGEMYASEAILILFNMGNEQFQKVSLHDDCLHIFENFVYVIPSVGVYNNEFIAIYTFSPGNGSMDVWVMKECGVKESWTKVIIELIPKVTVRLLAFCKNDKELLIADDDGNLCSFDRVTKEFKCHGLGTPGGWDQWSAVPYMKTIVSVNKREEGIVKEDYLC